MSAVAINKLSALVDGAFEGLLKIAFRRRYPLQPIFVEKAMERAILENTKVFKNGVLPPNKIKVLLSQEDYADFKKIEGIFLRQIETTALNFIENGLKEQSLEISRPVISVVSDPDLARGEVKVLAEHQEGEGEDRK